MVFSAASPCSPWNFSCNKKTPKKTAGQICSSRSNVWPCGEHMMEESRCEEEEDRRVAFTMSVLGPQGYTIYISNAGQVTRYVY